MPTFDATAKAALNQPVIAPAFFIFLDILGDPIRVTTGPAATFSSTGDSDLDGTYSAIDPTVLTVGDVSNQDGGSDTVTIDLSGIPSVDTTLMTEIGNFNAQARGRVCRMWMQVYDASGAAQGAIVPYYTGYMSAVTVLPGAETQSVRLQVENYLAAFNQASNRTYQSQTLYDPADTSSAALVAAANGTTPGQSVPVGIGAGGANFGPLERQERQVSSEAANQ